MRVTIIYNEPEYSRYAQANEQQAIEGVLTEAVSVEQALRSAGYTVRKLGLSLKSNVIQELSELDTDIVFNLFEGFSGFPETEPDIPEILERLRIPYTGCPADALRMALNKSELKTRLRKGGVCTPESQLLTLDTVSSLTVPFPCIVKPNSDDASHGVSTASVVKGDAGLRKQMEVLFDEYGYGQALVEAYIDGREFNATVMGNDDTCVTGVSEIVFTLPDGVPNIITYAGKWDETSVEYRGTRPVCPSRISREEKIRIHDIVQRSFTITGCRGYARVDMRMNDRSEIFVLEVNPNPDISPDSGAALQAESFGMKYPAFIERIVALAVERFI